MAESNTRNIIPNDLVSTMQLIAKKLNYKSLKDVKDSDGHVKSGEQMYIDLKRMSRTLVINGRKMIDDNEEEKKSLIDKAMEEVDESLSLLYELDYGNKNYRPYLREVLKRIFQYAGAEVPNESIIEELITHCNQAAYDGYMQYNLTNNLLSLGNSDQRVIYINCNDSDHIELKLDMKAPLRLFDDTGNVIETLYISSSLEFKLRSRGDKVEYIDGKLPITLPEELRQDENLFAGIKDFLIEMVHKIKAFFGIEELEVKILYGSKEPQTKVEEGTVKPVQPHRVEEL